MAPATDKFRGRVQISLRLDKELRQQIENAADRSLRTMNAEIIWRLRASIAEQMADEGAHRHA
jgi:hypothetical protein